MQKVIDQLAAELSTEVEHINSVKIDKESHTVDFNHGQVSMWAKLYKNNKSVKKNSVRNNRYG